MSAWPRAAKLIEVPLYGCEVYFVNTREDWDKCMVAIGCTSRAEGMAGLSAQMVGPEGRTIFMVGVFDGGLQTLIHELAHTTFHILEYVGVPVERGAPNEAYCYLLDTLFELTPDKVKIGLT